MVSSAHCFTNEAEYFLIVGKVSDCYVTAATCNTLMAVVEKKQDYIPLINSLGPRTLSMAMHKLHIQYMRVTEIFL